MSTTVHHPAGPLAVGRRLPGWASAGGGRGNAGVVEAASSGAFAAGFRAGHLEGWRDCQAAREPVAAKPCLPAPGTAPAAGRAKPPPRRHLPVQQAARQELQLTSPVPPVRPAAHAYQPGTRRSSDPHRHAQAAGPGPRPCPHASCSAGVRRGPGCPQGETGPAEHQHHPVCRQPPAGGCRGPVRRHVPAGGPPLRRRCRHYGAVLCRGTGPAHEGPAAQARGRRVRRNRPGPDPGVRPGPVQLPPARRRGRLAGHVVHRDRGLCCRRGPDGQQGPRLPVR